MVPKLSYIKCYDDKLFNTFFSKPFSLKIENGPSSKCKVKKSSDIHRSGELWQGESD